MKARAGPYGSYDNLLKYMYTTRAERVQGDSKRLSERVSAREKLSVETGKQERKSVTGQTLTCVLRLFH